MHFKLFRIGVIIILGITLFSCNSEENEEPTAPTFSEDHNSMVVLRINKETFNSLNSDRINEKAKGDVFKINRAERLGSLILVNISYSGGCKDHQFEVIWDGIVYTNNPCYFNLMITHNANNDQCEALITKDIAINLKDLLGDVNYNNNCTVNLFNTFNNSNVPDVIIK